MSAVNPAELDIEAMLQRGNVVVCCGTGGVGKTSVAATLGILSARMGQRTVVVTVDPARRLASALGLDTNDQGNEIHAVPLSGGASMDVVMLDAQAMFDGLVRSEAPSPEQAAAILGNPMYRSIAGALGGTQEYMAAELLHQLLDSDRYDMVIVDTPPSRHALDLLDAPTRITRLLDNRLIRLLMVPARTTLRAAGGALDAVLRSLGRVVGGPVLADAVAFLRSFDGMEEGFRERSRVVDAILASPATAYLLVTSPQAEPVQEAMRFVTELERRNRAVSAVVVNRVAPIAPPSPGLETEVAALAHRSDLSIRAQTALAEGATMLAEVAQAQATLVPFRAITSDAHWFSIPRRADDVHDVDGLQWMADQIRPLA